MTVFMWRNLIDRKSALADLVRECLDLVPDADYIEVTAIKFEPHTGDQITEQDGGPPDERLSDAMPTTTTGTFVEPHDPAQPKPAGHWHRPA
jgi:hypothetical protein